MEGWMILAAPVPGAAGHLPRERPSKDPRRRRQREDRGRTAQGCLRVPPARRSSAGHHVRQEPATGPKGSVRAVVAVDDRPGRVRASPRWALRLLAQRGTRADLGEPGRDASSAWSRAWASSGVARELAEAGLPNQYCKDEVSHVIKGRGLGTLDEYLELVRVGRRTPLRAEAAQAGVAALRAISGAARRGRRLRLRRRDRPGAGEPQAGTGRTGLHARDCRRSPGPAAALLGHATPPCPRW